MTIVLTVRPITVWPGKETERYMRSRAPFRSTWMKTSDLLMREIEKATTWNAAAVLEAFIRESDVRQDGWIRANVTPSKPGVILNFTHREHGPLRFPCDRFDDWQDNVRAIALALESLRQIERYGIVRKAEQYAGWKALPASTAVTMTSAQAAAILAKEAGAIASAILDSRIHALTCWRTARNRAHPDAGGTPERFHLVDQAWAQLERHFGSAA